MQMSDNGYKAYAFMKGGDCESETVIYGTVKVNQAYHGS